MSIYAIAELHHVHTCPADPRPHPFGIERTVLHVTPGRPCTNPIRITVGATTAMVDCGRHEPADRQCAGCRTITYTRSITSIDYGHQDGHGCAPAPSGLNPDPCPECGQPVAAILTRHLFCAPRRDGRVA